MALDLPFCWKLWALNAQEGDLDKRQQAFFLSTCKNGVIPEKLIVATPEPVTRLGKPVDPNAAIVYAYCDLGLESSFMKGGKLAKDRCRLDISGDIHHYARYWGTGSTEGSAPQQPNYAS